MTLVLAHAAAQSVVVDTISAMQPWPPHELFTFPHFSTPGQPLLAERINRDICIDFLEVDPDTANGSIFQVAWGDSAHTWIQPLSSLSWTVAQPMPKALSIAISAEGCGAYCEWFTTHYNYDLRDGHRLSFDSLFTEDGRITVEDTLRKHWKTAVEAQIQVIQDSLQVVGLSLDERAGWEDALDMYRQCLLEREDRSPYVSDFEPLGRELRVSIDRCSAHVNRNLDDLGEVNVDLPYEWLVPYLRPEVGSLIRK
ncbi:MAG: hypothetical protein ABI373_05050 [Flavobacteriales bacterium]